jgi:hypothetical protein
MIAESEIPVVGEEKNVKVGIAMASHEMVPATFMYDLASMVAYTVAVMPPGAQLGLSMVSGTYVHAARQKLLEMLLADETNTHILWVDTDMRFPRESIAWLIRHDVDVVGINYAKREIPTDYVAIKRLGSRDNTVPSERLVTDDSSTGLVEVDALGFGLTLMKTSALRDLPSLDEIPWFWFEWWKGRRQVGEDVYFCNLLRERGVRLLVDHDLSRQCAHVGQFDYRLEHVDVQRST